MAGGYGATDNLGYYLYTGNAYWTMSPCYFDGSYAIVRIVSSSGFMDGGINVNDSKDIRPVINLIPDSLISGDGSALNPFLVG